MKPSTGTICAMLIGLSALTGLASAQPAPRSASVSAERQLLLKRKLMAGEQTLLATLRQNIDRWDNITAEQREMLRERAYAFRDAPPAQQQAILDAWDKFRQLHPDRQDAYRQRAVWLRAVLENVTPDKRAQLLGMTPAERAAELLRLKAELQAQGVLPPDEPATQPTP